ncbi:TPA: hypothetical protein U1C78_002350 [Streptococcus suis]|nr:hypothetical protein [Streptococcus suis]
MPRKVFDKTFKIAAVKLILEEGQSIKIGSSLKMKTEDFLFTILIPIFILNLPTMMQIVSKLCLIV